MFDILYTCISSHKSSHLAPISLSPTARRSAIAISRLVSRRTARSGGTSRRATGVSGSTGSIPAAAVTPVASTTTVSSSTSSTLVTSERCVLAPSMRLPPREYAALVVLFS